MFKTSAIILAAASLCGCATIIEGGSQPVTFTSTPDAASISIVNKAGLKIHSGMTPATVPLKRGTGYFRSEQYKVVIEKPGFEPQTIYLSASVNGWYIGNIIFGGLIGLLVVDPLTGAMYSFPSDTMDSTLVPLEKVGTSAGALNVALLQDIPVDARQQLQFLQFATPTTTNVVEDIDHAE